MERVLALEVHWRVDERLRSELENSGAKPMDINNKIIKEAQKIVFERITLEKQMHEKDFSGDLGARTVYHALLYKASKGHLPPTVIFSR